MTDCSECIYEDHCQDVFRRLVIIDNSCRFYKKVKNDSRHG